uniref:Uncharacterized protein n=2 Tax=Cacopsylla melanoneura TaxID=428564 RepID=A0A8D8U458_9HEMI
MIIRHTSSHRTMSKHAAIASMGQCLKMPQLLLTIMPQSFCRNDTKMLLLLLKAHPLLAKTSEKQKMKKKMLKNYISIQIKLRTHFPHCLTIMTRDVQNTFKTPFQIQNAIEKPI